MDYDIVIIGAGPAGSTLARLLNPKFKVAIIDKKNGSPQSFKKPCGGLLAPDSQKSLSKMGLSMPKDIMASPQIFAVETIDLKQNLKKYYQRFYLNLDRHKFDMWLISLIPSNVDVFLDSFCNRISKTESGYNVEYISEDNPKTISCRYLVGADGAKSQVREIFNVKPVRQYLSIQKNYKAVSSEPYYVCFFDSGVTDCYGWINSKDDVIQLGGAFNKKTAKEDFKKVEDYFIAKGYPFKNPVNTEACMVNRPKRAGEVCIGKDNVLLTGEAAGFISTSSLEGISFGLDSGAALARAFNKDDNVYKNYNIGTKKLRFKVFTKIVKSPFIYNQFLRKLVMKSGITSINMY